MPDAVLGLTGKLRAITVHVHALQPPLQPILEEGYVSKHARANRVHVTSLGSAGPAGRTAVQVPDRSGTGSGIESQPVRATMGIRWLDSPEISTTNFSMFAFRNCLLRTMPRELNQGYRVNSASGCYLKKDQHKPIVAVGVSESCQIRHNMKTFGANGTSPTRCDQATASEHKRWRADECVRIRDSKSCDSERKDTKQARAVYNGEWRMEHDEGGRCCGHFSTASWVGSSLQPSVGGVMED